MAMRKLIYALMVLLVAAGKPCAAKDDNTNDVLVALVSLAPADATPEKIKHVLGSPASVDEGKKRTEWHYSVGGNDVTVSWNNKTQEFEKLSFTNSCNEKCEFDSRLSRKLRSGRTDLRQTISILGAPKDMTVRGSKQELHYSYNNSVLRLFFRNHVLVDFTLMSGVR